MIVEVPWTYDVLEENDEGDFEKIGEREGVRRVEVSLVREAAPGIFQCRTREHFPVISRLVG